MCCIYRVLFSVFFIFILFFVVVVVVGTLAAMMFNTKENFFGRINMKMEIIFAFDHQRGRRDVTCKPSKS